MTDISVVIPTYRPGTYLRDCLNSLWTQTLSHDCFEVIIVLNGCNEPYRTEIENCLAQKTNNVKVLFLQTDQGGVSNARNIGIDHARGQYVCFIDDDDWVSDSYLEFLLKASMGSNCIVESNVLDYDETRSVYTDDYLTTVYKRLSATSKDLSVLAARRLLSSSCCKLIPRKVIGETRFNKNFRIGEDALFMAEISKNIQSVRLSNPDAIYYRRLRTNSASRSTVSSLSRIKNALSLCSQYVKIYMSSPTKYCLPFFINRILAVTKITVKLTFS